MALLYDWEVWARDDQLEPADEEGQNAHGCDDQNGAEATRAWRTWLVLGGRGAGKTRTGAEWIRSRAIGAHAKATTWPARIALIGETLNDVRNVMVEGESGLLAIHPPHERPRLETSRQRLVWPNGAIAYLFSAETPEALRGPQFTAAWCDEIAKWRLAEHVWDMLQFGLRLGNDPRTIVTTTPRPVPFLKKLMGDAGTVLTQVKTTDNRANLAATFLSEMERKYAGTRLGRQELDGQWIEETDGALWREDWFAETRVSSPPPLQRIVVAVDPPVTALKTSDACGIVVVGRTMDGTAAVLADRTVQGRAPLEWARAAVEAYREFKADRIVAEVNQGGDLVTTVVRQVLPSVPITTVRATRGKWTRAEPVAALYAEGRVVHVGEHRELEEQMLGFGVNGQADGRSPDRVDALVWGITELLLTEQRQPMMRRL